MILTSNSKEIRAVYTDATIRVYQAYNKTIETGTMTYYSRSRDELWIKGLTSGHYQYVKSLIVDCDKDTLLAKVEQVGAACHTGNRSCFFTEIYNGMEK